MSDLEAKKAAAAAAAAAAKPAKTPKADTTEADAAKKKAAAEAAAKAAKEKKAAADKAAADAKQLEVRKEVEAKFNSLIGAVDVVRNALTTVTEDATVEIVTQAESAGTNALPAIKEGLKSLKASVKKSKGEDLSGAVTTGQAAVDEVIAAVKGLKDKLTAAKNAEKEAEKAREKADREKLKEANRQPEQNGVRRPNPDTACGKAWALMDTISATMGQPAPISHVLSVAGRHSLNEDTVKTQYARWKKFNGVTGRVPTPLPAELSSL